MTAKERIKQFIDNKRITYRKFYEETGLSNSFLSNASAVSSDNLEKISIQYPELNLEWVITGRGSMVKGKEVSLHWGKAIEAVVRAYELTDEEISKQTGITIERLKTLYTFQIVDVFELYRISLLIGWDLMAIYNNINGTNYQLPTDMKITWQGVKEIRGEKKPILYGESELTITHAAEDIPKKK